MQPLQLHLQQLFVLFPLSRPLFVFNVQVSLLFHEPTYPASLVSPFQVLPNALSSHFRSAVAFQSFLYQFCLISVFVQLQSQLVFLTFLVPHVLTLPSVRSFHSLFYFTSLTLLRISLVLSTAVCLVQFLTFLLFLFISILLLFYFRHLFTIAPRTLPSKY